MGFNQAYCPPRMLDKTIEGREADTVPVLEPRELYPLYVTFQSRFQEYATVSCHTEFAREHYRRVFQPFPFEVFEARLVRWTAAQIADHAQIWQSGFDAWVRSQDINPTRS
jgi:hypothetical protein